jgi:sodium-dependent dicarboxylate transporter 2/3/5
MLVKFLARCNFENVHLSDTGISIFSAILLFIIPVPNGKRLLEWSDTEKLPWGILLLFGGGLSLAKGFEVTGVIDYIGASFSQLDDLSLIALIAIFALVALYLTEFMSNMALVSIFIPVVAAIAQGMGESPLLFAVPATMAASCAFMFPMSTPPNAIVFSSGYVRIPQMARAGFLLNIVAVLVITMFCYFVLSKTLIGTSL